MAYRQSLLQAAKILKLAKNYFYVLKKNNPFMFRYISLLGKGNLVVGYRKFQERKRVIADFFLEAYNQLEKKRKLTTVQREIFGNRKHVLYNLGRSIKERGIQTERALIYAWKTIRLFRKIEGRREPILISAL